MYMAHETVLRLRYDNQGRVVNFGQITSVGFVPWLFAELIREDFLLQTDNKEKWNSYYRHSCTSGCIIA